MRQIDPLEKPTSHEKPQSPKTSARKNWVGTCWRTEILKGSRMGRSDKVSLVCGIINQH